jgi:hypothetical protein
MTTPNSISEDQDPPKPNSHISAYRKVAPDSLSVKELRKFGILYSRKCVQIKESRPQINIDTGAYFIDHFLDENRTDGNLPGKKKKDEANRILDKWNTGFGLYKGFRKYKDLECLKST